MPFLSDFVNSRDNNFNLLRFIAASLVIFGHSWPGADPLMSITRTPSAHMAVDIFFGISGFLVTGSLLSRKNVLAFATARLLRLVPGLFISTLITVFGIGLYFTTLPTREYLHHADIYQYIWINCTLLDTQPSLPGVFDGNVNGPLWTLQYEFRMYATLACIGLLVYCWPRLLPERFAAIAVVAIALVTNGGLLLIAYGSSAAAETLLEIASLSFWRLAAMFFLGGTYYVFRRFIPVNIFMLLAVLVALYISMQVYFTDTGNNCLYFGAYSLLLPYLALYFAYMPGRFLRKFNEIGDYSYGIYIYGFPMQRSVMAMGWDSSPWMLFFLAFPPALLFAILSWHLIEKRAIALKDIYIPVQTTLEKLVRKLQHST
jgi:peptidoglycan/LPS O-acetylase OafA/YrhL